jgi:cytochrome c oxidase subunit II
MALVMAVLVFILTILITVLFAAAGKIGWWFPELISQYGEIDRQFVRTLLVTGLAFVASHVALGYCLFRYRSGNGEKAIYSHGNTRLEVVWTLIIALVFIVTAFLGQRVWLQLHLTNPPPDALKIEVVGQQFAWIFRYSGSDGKFGKTDPKEVNDQDNPLGLVPSDPDGKDDIVSRGKMVIPKDRAVHLILRSKDVTHSFFIPSLRFKQDVVPGMNISVHFTANKIVGRRIYKPDGTVEESDRDLQEGEKELKKGELEIVCAELCGLGHYKMRGVFEVKESADYDKWLSGFKGAE